MPEIVWERDTPQPAKLRVLFINSIQMWGGAEVWLMDVMHGLQDRGHQVALFCRPNTVLERNARAEGFDVTAIPMRSDFDPLTIWQVWRIIRRKRIQILCTNMDKELRFGGLAAKLAGGVAVIPSREVDYPLKNRLRYRLTYNRLADYILANSHATKQTLLRDAPWLDPARIEVVHKGIDPAPYLAGAAAGRAVRRELGIAAKDKVIGFVGQIIERKGIADIVAGMPLVLEQMPEARFLFAGEGKLLGFVQQRIAEYGIADRVILTGFRKDVPAIMNAIDLLLLPSIVEGFGYVLVEAMAASKPVVATNVSSIPEIVQHEHTGLLIDVHAPDQLAAAAVRILRDPALAARLGEAGRQRVLQNFTIERMVAQTEAIFADFARGIKRRAPAPQQASAG